MFSVPLCFQMSRWKDARSGALFLKHRDTETQSRDRKGILNTAGAGFLSVNSVPLCFQIPRWKDARSGALFLKHRDTEAQSRDRKGISNKAGAGFFSVFSVPYSLSPNFPAFSSCSSRAPKRQRRRATAARTAAQRFSIIFFSFN